jgi:mannose-6-phosphate isomerase-like protein (cupin superfamily)
MPVTVAPFDSLPWTPGAHPLERKKAQPGRGLAMLRFAPGFADPAWCERSHVMYVIDGVLELELAEGPLTLSAGQCVALDRGTRHRARNPGESDVTVFVVSDCALAD